MLSKKENDDLSAEEKAELEQLLREDPSIAAANAVFEQMMQQKMTVREQPIQPGDSWSLIKARMAANESAKEMRMKPRFPRFLAAASIIIIVIASAMFAYYQHGLKVSKEQVAGNQVSTPMGSRSKIVLPDGTKVWLNAGSRITYNDFQTSGSREVHLSGEAYFDVVHSDTHPFIVHTDRVDIHDLGTVFNVKAYPHEKNVETTLIEGSVEVVDHHDQQKKIMLKPNEKLTILLEPKEVQTRRDSVIYSIVTPKKNTQGLMAETAWIDNKLVFNNEGFHQLAGRMERWYNVRFHFDNSGVAMTPFSGTIENETLEQALQAMQFSTSFHYRLSGNEVWISK